MSAYVNYLLSRDPIEVDITPNIFRGLSFKRDLAIMGKLDQLTQGVSCRSRGTPSWLIGNSTGVRFDVQKPQVRLYFLRSVGDTDEQIEAARLALVAELSALKPVLEEKAQWDRA